MILTANAASNKLLIAYASFNCVSREYLTVRHLVYVYDEHD